MNERRYKRLTQNKKRVEVFVDYMKILLKALRVLFYLSFMAAIIITDHLTFLKSLVYLGAIVLTYLVIRIIVEKIIQHKIKVIDHINHHILSEFSLKNNPQPSCSDGFKNL